MKKLLCAILAATMALSFASCEFKSPASVIKVNGEEISSGVYLIYQYLAYSNAANLAEDDKKDLLKQNIEDVPAAEWIHTETLNNIKNYIYTEKAFEEKGYSFTQDELSSFKNEADEIYAGNEKMFSSNGIGKSSYFVLYLNAKKDAKLVEDYRAANAITDDEIRKYTDETYANIARVSFPTTDKDSNALTEEQTKALDDIASELVANCKNGLTKELAEPAIKKAVEAVGREFNENTVDSYFTTSYLSEDSISYFTDEIKAEMLASKVGDVKVGAMDTTKFVWGRVEVFPTEEDFEELKPTVTTEIQNNKYTDEIKLVTDTYSVEEIGNAVSYYSVKKVKLM